MKKLLIPVLFISCLIIFPSQSSALNLMESFFLKITVLEDDIEYQWEYTSPGKYEYEKGEKVVKTKEAKEAMAQILQILDLSEKANVENMVKALKEDRFPHLEHLDIRWMTGEHKLYTWVWDVNN